MGQSNLIDAVKEWLETQTPVMRLLASVGGVVVAGLVVVALLCVIAGWTTPRELSDALFYASSAMFAVSLVIYFSYRGPAPDGDEEEDKTDAQTMKGLLMRRRRRRDIPFYAVVFIVAGVVLFLISIGLWYALS